MRTIKLPLLFAIFILAFTGYAQEKIFDFKDASNLNHSIMPKRIANLAWVDKSELYSFIENNAVLLGSAVNENAAKTLVTLTEMNTLLKKYEIKIERIPSIQWKAVSEFTFQNKSQLFGVNVETKSILLLNNWPESAENIEIEPNTNRVAYTIANNLFVAENKEQLQLTNDLESIVNGQTVHRSEFGITGGIFWSPKGNFIAYYQKDESLVGDYPLVDIMNPEATAKMIKYPMAGTANEKVKLAVYDIQNKKTVYLKTGENIDQYLTSVSWSPDEKQIYIAVLNRDQNYLKLNKYDAQTGDFLLTLFEEKSDTWVEPEHPLTFLKNRPDQFVWFSERDGWQHLYIYTTNGQFVQQITQGEWNVTEILGFDKTGENILIEGTKESPLENHIYSIHLKSAKIKKLSIEHGTHAGTLSPSGEYLFDSYSNTETARVYEIFSSAGKKTKELLRDANPLKDYKLGKIIMGKLKNEDNTDLYYRLILPTDFDSTQSYPVFYYLYGGPHAQLVTDSWLSGANVFMELMAQRGYIVFTLDNRGTPNRGFAFENAIHRKLGRNEVADQMVGVRFLQNLPFVDAERMGIQGWSYGGFMTLSMLADNPGVFKAGVAGGPVTDWKYYEIMYGERYMDMPEQNPEGYKQNSLLLKSGNIKDRILIIHGDIDPTVVWQNSLSFLKSAIDAGVQVDYFVYPQQEHNMRGTTRAHLLEKIYLYMEDFVK